MNPDPKALPFRESHPRFEETWASRGMTADLEAFEFRRRIEYDAKCNWKLWYDNNVECYHCARIHGKSFAAAYDVAPENTDNFELDRMITYKFLATGSNQGDEPKSSNYRSMQLFPGITMIQQDDLMVLSQMIPIGPEQTISVMDYFAERGGDEKRFERWVALWDQTFTRRFDRGQESATGSAHRAIGKDSFHHNPGTPIDFCEPDYSPGVPEGSQPRVNPA